MPQKPYRIIVRCIIPATDGTLLAIRRSYLETEKTGYWELPGGHIDHGEDPIRGAQREVREETRLQVTDIRLLTVHSRLKSNTDEHIIAFCYLAQAIDKLVQPVSLSDEHDQFTWLTHAQFLQEKISKRTRFYLQEYLKKSQELEAS